MPELPEVETTRRGIEPHIINQHINKVVVRNHSLRWPIPSSLPKTLTGLTVTSIERRAKYLLLHTETGTLMIHLGMSGSLRITNPDIAPEKHDHLDICFDNGNVLRMRDPRRFGAVLWCDSAPLQHKLLKNLGIEPLSRKFNGEYLYQDILPV